MPSLKRQFLKTTTGLLAGLLLAGVASAQSFPTKPVMLMVPYPAGGLSDTIAHELRTPVTSIRGYLETVLETPMPPEKERDFITKAYRQTLALSELIRDMSLLTKIEDTPGSFNFGRIDLGAVINRVTAELEPALRSILSR